MKYEEEKCSCFWRYKRFQVYHIFWCENKFGTRRNLIIMRLASLISLLLQHFLWNFVILLDFINFVTFSKSNIQCFSDWENLLKFKVEGREFAKILRSLKQFTLHSLTGKSLQWEQGFPEMNTCVSLWELTYREFPVTLTGFGFTVHSNSERSEHSPYIE